MKAASFRLRLMLPVLGVAGLLAALLVVFAHQRTRSHAKRHLEHALATKAEEIVALLRTETLDVAAFLELQCRYENAPYEFFYEIVDDAGRSLLRGSNLAQQALSAPEHGAFPLAVRPHPNEAGQEILQRSEHLPTTITFKGQRGPWLHVGVDLEAYSRAARANLGWDLLVALGALTTLGGALWIGISRSLRNVAAVTDQAASIRATGLRARLPINGSGDELDRLARVLNELLASVELSLEQMEAFTSDAAHQLRTPLTRIRGELDLVLTDAAELSSGTRTRLEEACGDLERLSQMCARLLLLARLDRGALESELQADQVDLSALARDLVEQVEPLAAEKGASVRCNLVSTTHIRGCRALLAEALLNLLDNAIRFTPPGGCVEVDVWLQEQQVFVAVRDSGPGVEADEVERVFRRFGRGSRPADPAGSGLGLAIVRGIARAHGGDVGLRSAPGAGADFRLFFPAA